MDFGFPLGLPLSHKKGVPFGHKRKEKALLFLFGFWVTARSISLGPSTLEGRGSGSPLPSNALRGLGAIRSTDRLGTA